MSNLYMTTEEFADMVVQALHDQNYFKRGTKAHPGDLVIAFTSTAESLATALEWAITKEAQVKKQAVMKTTNLSKVTYSRNSVLPQDDEIAPALLEPGESLIDEDWAMNYSEWKNSKKGK